MERQRRDYETVIIGGGPAGMGPLVWAARHGLLGAWLDSGVALVERRRWLGGSLGQYPLNADTVATTFLECLDGPDCEPVLADVRGDPVTQELNTWHCARPPIALVDRYIRRLGAAVQAEFARHPSSHVFTGTVAQTINLESDGSVAVSLFCPDGRRIVIRAASVVMALGGRQDNGWGTAELAPELQLGQWRKKIVTSDAMLSDGGADLARGLLARADRRPRAVIVGSSHSAFSAAWLLLDRIRGLNFGPEGVQILYRSEPRVMYPSSDAARADSFGFSDADVCQATGRVHRVGGLRGDGRELWRRMHGKPGTQCERRAVGRSLADLSRAELAGLLDDADLIVPALGYRLRTVPVFDPHGGLIPLARTGPAVGADSRLLTADGRPIPGVFGAGLGSGFVPWGAMAGEASFTGQQNSFWLFQHGLGEMIYQSTRQCVAPQGVSESDVRRGGTRRRSGYDLMTNSRECVRES